MSLTATTTQNPTPISPDKIKIGILLLGPGVQLLDLSAIDVLGLLEKSYLDAVPMPRELKSKFPGLDIDFRYITETGEGMQALTAGAKLGVTVRFEASSFSSADLLLRGAVVGLCSCLSLVRLETGVS